ncbi:outer membrane beta-barrel protein [soil metagenome]
MIKPTLRLFILPLAVAGSLSGAQQAAAQSIYDGPWLVRVRATQLDSVNHDSTRLDLSINDKWIPDFNVSYFFTPQIAAELVLTVPQKQTIRSEHTRIGSFKHLPPTLTLQYHFTSIPGIDPMFQPYVGVGVNYTRFSRTSFDPAVQAALQPSIENSSVGLAGQVGIDIAIARNWYANVDVKRVQIRTDVRSAGTTVGELKVDPWLFGIGIGRRF